MIVTNEMKSQMLEILKNKEIKSVFQPIVSLKTGTIYGYEALSRITLKKCSFNIGEAFEIAENLNCLWALEKLCRVNSIKMSSNKPKTAKLFLNADPNIIRDPEFKSGVTHEKLAKYNLDCSDIVFEATERSAIKDIDTFKALLRHYKEQGFCIAVDDVGSGYSGINRIFDLNPQFIKIDMEMIRDIDKDEMKRSFVSALIKKEILRLNNTYNKPRYSPAYFNTVAELCSKKPMIFPSTQFSDVYEIMHDPNITEMAIVDDTGRFLGVLTKRQVLQSLSGMYGYTLHARKNVGEVMDTACLTMTLDTPIETAAKMAMARCQPYIYDSIPIVDSTSQIYIGFVSIKDLLLAAVDIQVKRAADCNPLTGLPGNIIIDERVEKLIGNTAPFAIIYFDLDNFKAYNDAYGFTNGDMMIKMVADILTQLCSPDDFCGHIGGDDFVVITNGDKTEDLCKSAFGRFAEDSQNLYSEIDRERGYIVSKNRLGFIEEFPLATLSAAAITNREHPYASIKELSLVIAQTKKRAKQQTGNSLVIT